MGKEATLQTEKKEKRPGETLESLKVGEPYILRWKEKSLRVYCVVKTEKSVAYVESQFVPSGTFLTTKTGDVRWDGKSITLIMAVLNTADVEDIERTTVTVHHDLSTPDDNSPRMAEFRRAWAVALDGLLHPG